MARHVFNFEEQHYEIIEVNGQEFKLDITSDEGLREMQKKLRQFAITHMEYAQEVESLVGTDISEEMENELWDRGKQMVKEAIDALVVGDNQFERVYELSGKSLAKSAEFIYYVSQVIEEKVSSMKQGKKSKYTQKAGR